MNHSLAPNRWLSAVLSFMLLLNASQLIGCSDSAGGGGNNSPAAPTVEPVVELADPQGVLGSLGITELSELIKTVDEQGSLNFILTAATENADIESEDVVRLLRLNNKNIEYRKVAEEGVEAGVLEKLTALRLSPSEVKQAIKLPEFELIAESEVTAQALELYNRLRQAELNRKLNLRGQQGISEQQFLSLQKAMTELEIKDNFQALDQPFQNLIVEEPVVQSSAFVASEAQVQASFGEPQLPAGYRYVNPAREYQQPTPKENTPLIDDLCLLSSGFETFPQALSAQQPVNHLLIDNTDGDVTVHFPKAGIAVLRIDHSNDFTLQINREDGSNLVNQVVSQGDHVYLPILNSDSCDGFTLVGAANQYDVTLVDYVTAERFANQQAYIKGAKHITSDSSVSLLEGHNRFQAKSYSFTTFNLRIEALTFLLEAYADAEQALKLDVLIYSPSGKIYSSLDNTVANGIYPLPGLSPASVLKEAGVWRVDLLPAGSIGLTDNQITSIQVESAADQYQDRNLSAQLYVNVGDAPRSKEFILGTMASVAFTANGDSAKLSEGEANVMLNTSMAPPLEIPSLLNKVIDEDTGQLSDEVAIWQCWRQSAKTGFEFGNDKVCEPYRDTYLTLKQRFEDAADYSASNIGVDDYAIPQQERCPQWYEDAPADGLCPKGFGEPYDYPASYSQTPEDRKARYVMNDHAKKMRQRYAGEEFLYALSNHYQLYANWVARAVQVESSTFPMDRSNMKLKDHQSCVSAGISDKACIAFSGSTSGYFSAPVIVDANRPVFAAPVERVNQSTDPITFDYSARDEDVYDTNGELFAVLSFVASQALNVANGNFLGMVCDTVGLADDLHQLELDAKDDPIGSARMSINRFSSSDSFYGLNSQDSFRFYTSGYPEENTDVDTHGQKLNYAQAACGIAGGIVAGSAFASNADYLLSLDYGSIAGHDQIVASIRGMAAASNLASLGENAEAIATAIESRDFALARSLMQVSDNVDALSQGIDIYNSPEDLLASYRNEGSAANGNNIVKTNANFLLEGNAKTRAGIEFERIASLPVTDIKVTLDRINIISNYEGTKTTDSDAEVILRPFVGEVSDIEFNEVALQPHSVFQESAYQDQPITNLSFNGVRDGDELSPDTVVYSKALTRNTAALYIELSILEDDGFSAEDDDMIGIFSKTIKLEELLNNQDNEWQYLGGNQYRLVLNQQPVYNSSNQRILENPLSDAYPHQVTFNRNRRASAQVSFTIDLTLQSSFPAVADVDTSLNPNDIDSGKDVAEMNFSQLGSLNLPAGVENSVIHDVYANRIIVSHDERSLSEYSNGHKGSMYAIDIDSGQLNKLFDYDVEQFTGDLLPIKEALTSASSIGQVYDRSSGQRSISAIKLLSDNQLLFAFSADDGAQLFVVGFDGQGDMTLQNSHLLRDEQESIINTLANVRLSPDRQSMLITYIPAGDSAGDSSEFPETEVGYYSLSINPDSMGLLYQKTLNNPIENITEASFIDNSAFVVRSGRYQLMGNNSPNWDYLTTYLKDNQQDCSKSELNCFYELLDRELKVYSVNKDNEVHTLNLSEQIELPYTPIQAAGGPVRFRYGRVDMLLASPKKKIEAIRSVGFDDEVASFRVGADYFQMKYNDVINGYVLNGSSSFPTTREVFYNPLWRYYCGDGLTCSGYVKHAASLRPYGDEYYSEDNIHSFRFVDFERDLIIGLAYEVGQGFLRSYSLFEADADPETFTFSAISDGALDTLFESEEFVVAGINRYASISVIHGEYWRSSTAEWTDQSALDLAVGERIKVRTRSSANYSTTRIATLTIGNVMADFTVRTLDDPNPIDAIPDAFSFLPLTEQSRTSLVESNVITVTGINTTVPVSISGGEYSVVGSNVWSSSPSIVNDGQALLVRHFTSSELNTVTTTTLTIGTISADFVTTTVVEPEKNAPFINGFATTCSIDSPQCDFSFADDADWRAAITRVEVFSYSSDSNILLSAPGDYQLTAGNLKLLINASNNMVKRSGSWTIRFKAAGYYDSEMQFMIEPGYVRVSNIQHSEMATVGKIITVTMDLENRFGEPAAYGNIQPELTLVNNTADINEVYRSSGGGSGFVSKPLSLDKTQNNLQSDEQGHISFQLHIPGCVDLNDGFTLKYSDEVNSHSYFRNLSGACIDTEWTKRLASYATYADDKNIAVDSDGNVYYAINSANDYGEIENLGSSDIYVVKYDRNGEQQWIKQVATPANDSIGYFGIYRSSIIVAGQTSGDIDGNGSGINSGSSDVFVSRINHEGNVIWHKQWGSANSDGFIAAGSRGTDLYIAAFMDAGGSEEGQEIHRISLENGNHERIMTSTDTPADSISDIEVVADTHGNVRYYLATSRHIYRINADDGNYDARSLRFSSGGSIWLSYNQDVVYASMSAASQTGGEDFGTDDNYKARVVALDEDTLAVNWSRIISTGGRNSQGGYPIESYDGVVYISIAAAGLMYPDDTLTFEPQASLNLLALHGMDGHEINHRSWYTTDHQQAALLLSDMEVSSSGVLHVTGNVRDAFNNTGRLTAAYPFTYEGFILKAPITVNAEALTQSGLDRLDIAEIVRDFDNNLEWDDRSSSILQQTSWSGAVADCNDLMLNSRVDWRLPSADELNRVGHIPAADTAFKFYEVLPDDLSGGLDGDNSQQAYWTSLGSIENQEAELMWIHAPELYSIFTLTSDWHKYRCVRDMN